MRLVLIPMLIAATPAAACNTDFLTIEDWSIVEQRSGPKVGADVTFDYRSTGDQAYRLIEASIIVEDTLGMRPDSVAVPREQSHEPGETGRQSGLYPSSGLMMAGRMNRDDMRVTTCTRTVIYTDGSRESFD